MPVHTRTITYAPPAHPAEMAADLLRWFGLYQRDLPWRRSHDPYHIWVSEVMLQQTRVETVIPYYERWIERFPTLQHLAAAPEEAVLKAWEGLGYYSRARNLHGAVKEVVARYGGEIPADADEIATLKGVGPYTAGALLSIAYNLPLPAVDGNVMRVLARLCLIQDDIAQPATRKGMEELARRLMPEDAAGAFNQALMELGAIICTPTSPRCTECPVAVHCGARAEKAERSLPVKSKAKAPRSVDMVAAVVWNQGRVLITRRPAQGLLGGLWELPGGERPPSLTWEQAVHVCLAERLGMVIEVEAHLASVRHLFTHRVWDLRAYTASMAPGSPIPDESDDLRWVAPSHLHTFAFPVAYQKIIEKFLTC